MAGFTLLLLIGYVTSQVSAVLLPPSTLEFDSNNFEHILTWDDPNNESVIYYKVGYKKDNQIKVSKSCSNITSRRCDLTKDLTDLTTTYSVWVHSFTDRNKSKNAIKEFCPITGTTLGPALVNVVPGDYSIEVSIDPPISHLWNETEQRNVTMVSDVVYPVMEYTIHYGQPGESPQHITLDSTMNSTVISQLLPNANYCVWVDLIPEVSDVRSKTTTEKCVITGPHTDPQGSSLSVIIPVVCGILLIIGILLVLFSLDRAGYIGKRRSFIPEVLKSFSQSERRYSGSDDFTSPTCVVPVEIVSQKPELKESQETKGQYQEGGYACRKKLLDSDTSAGDSSGTILSSNSLSLQSSGQMTVSSDEERFSSQNQKGLDIVKESDGSFSPIPANDLGSSSDLPLNNSRVFNINLNSICIDSQGDTLTGLKIGGSLVEEPMQKTLINSGQPEVSLNGDITVCMPNILADLNPTETDYGSDNYEDLSDNADDDDSDCVGSGYMRR